MAKKDKKEFKLKQTKGYFTLKGIVDGMSRQKTYQDVESDSGKMKGKSRRSLNFFVQTSKINKIPVQIFQFEQDNVYASKRTKQGEERAETIQIPWAKRDKQALPEGYSIMGVSCGLEQGDDGKNIVKTLHDFDAAEYIFENLNDGDSVFVRGEIQFSQYVDASGNKKNQTRYAVKNIYLEKKPVDFEAEGFVETAAFEQTIVFVDSAREKKENNAVYVDAYIINYGDKFVPAKFVIRPEDDKDLEKTANVFDKKLKFGDTFKVLGNVLNKANVEDAESDDDDFFGGHKPEGAKQTFTTYTSELQITTADGESYKEGKGLYTDNDFIVQEDEELVNKEEELDFGGKNPGGKDNDKQESFEDEELPF